MFTRMADKAGRKDESLKFVSWEGEKPGCRSAARNATRIIQQRTVYRRISGARILPEREKGLNSIPNHAGPDRPFSHFPTIGVQMAQLLTLHYTTNNMPGPANQIAEQLAQIQQQLRDM